MNLLGLCSYSFGGVQISVGTATQLAIATQPSGAIDGSDFDTQPVIELQDINGVLVPTSGVDVVASIANGIGTLSGTTTIATVNGRATFTNLRVSNASGFHTLHFASGSLTPVDADPLVVAQNQTTIGVTVS